MLFHLDRGLVGVLGMLIASTRFRGLMTMPSAARARRSWGQCRPGTRGP